MKNTRKFSHSVHAPSRTASDWLLGASLSAVLSLGLVACGGGTTASDSSAETREAYSAQSSSEQSAASVQAELSKGASLSTAELAAAEKAAVAADASGLAIPLEEVKEGQAVPKSAYASGEVARKAAAVRIPVYRFVNPETGAYFLTTDERERDKVRDTPSSPWRYEGESFSVASAFSPGLSPVHRFHNLQTGEYLYTISEAERAHVAARLPQYRYEGVAFYASPVGGDGLVPVARVAAASKEPVSEQAFVTKSAKLPNDPSFDAVAVGVGYYGFESIWKPDRLPHTGITDQQCFPMTETLDFISCNSSEAIAFNPQQDGHRTAIRPMSYSAVQRQNPGFARPTYPLTSCVKDNVTGLIWEGKTDDGGLRDKDNTYTNLNNGLTNDTSGYVAAVNASKLCGYSDWRLPNSHELLGIMDFGSAKPSIEIAWFPHTVSASYWTSTEYTFHSDYFGDQPRALAGNFSHWTGIDSHPRSTSIAVRLVRGSAPSGRRFSYTTAAYSGDAANNVVRDAWTGLQWRRCEEGRAWDGTTCTGAAGGNFYRSGVPGWRLPNVKELASLVDMGSIGAEVFPGEDVHLGEWSSTPDINGTRAAMKVGDDGWVGGVWYVMGITHPPIYTRLVRVTP